MSSRKRIGSFLANLWGTVNTEKAWLVFLGNQLKWAIGFFVRVLTIALTILFTLVIIKKLNIAQNIRSLVVHDLIGIKTEKTGILSSPEIDYTKDLNSIDDIINMLETRKGDAADAKSTGKDIR